MTIENCSDAGNFDQQDNTNQNVAEDSFEPEVINESKPSSGKPLNEVVWDSVIALYQVC